MSESDTILIIDDEPEIGRMVSAALAARGATVFVARTAAEALELGVPSGPLVSTGSEEPAAGADADRGC